MPANKRTGVCDDVTTILKRTARNAIRVNKSQNVTYKPTKRRTLRQCKVPTSDGNHDDRFVLVGATDEHVVVLGAVRGV